MKLWESLWRMPQAIVWEELHQEMQVAFYTFAFLLAQSSDTTPSQQTVALRMAGELGVTIPGMRSHRWTIDPPVTEEEAPAPVERPAGRAAARDRLRLVSPG